MITPWKSGYLWEDLLSVRCRLETYISWTSLTLCTNRSLWHHWIRSKVTKLSLVTKSLFEHDRSLTFIDSKTKEQPNVTSDIKYREKCASLRIQLFLVVRSMQIRGSQSHRVLAKTKVTVVLSPQLQKQTLSKRSFSLCFYLLAFLLEICRKISRTIELPRPNLNDVLYFGAIFL